METYTKVSGFVVNAMVKGLTQILLVDMLASLTMISKKVLEYYPMLMVESLKVNSKKEKHMEMESIPTPIILLMKAIGKKVKEMERSYKFKQTVLK